MSSMITKTYYEERTATTTLMIAHIQCDTVSDLPQSTAFQGITLLMSTIADIITDGSEYKMDSSGTWHKQTAGGGGGDTYTKSEIDAMLALLQPLDIPQTITAPADLDDIVALGSYQYSAADAASITGKPQAATAAARLDVQQLPENQLQQILRTVDTSAIQIFVRNSTGSSTPTEQQVVPAMTSDTAPSGRVIYSGQYQTRYAYQAFDGVDSQSWQSNSWGDGTNALTGDPADCYVGYEFVSPTEITRFSLCTTSDMQYTAEIQLRISGVWTTAISAITIPGNGYSQQSLSLQAPTTCDAFRLSITGGAAQYFTTNYYGGNVCELYAYGMKQNFTWSSWAQVDLT